MTGRRVKPSGEHKTLQLGRGVAGAAMLAIERSLAAWPALPRVWIAWQFPTTPRVAILREAEELRRQGANIPQRSIFCQPGRKLAV